MKINVALDRGGLLPTRAHKEDAGWDLYSPYGFKIPGKGHASVDTGVHIEIPEGYVGMLKSKSGLNVFKNLTSEGVIDAGYTGSIVVKLYNHGRKKQIIESGQKITQLVIMPIADVEELVRVDSINTKTDRGTNGFGSTGA